MDDEVKLTNRGNGGAPYEWTMRAGENGSVTIECDGETIWASGNGDGTRLILRPNSA